MFSTQSDNCIPLVHIFEIISVFAAELQEPKIGISGKGLTYVKEQLGILVITSLCTKQQIFTLVLIESICNKLTGTEKLKFYLGRVENIVVKGKNAGY